MFRSSTGGLSEVGAILSIAATMVSKPSYYVTRTMAPQGRKTAPYTQKNHGSLLGGMVPEKKTFHHEDMSTGMGVGTGGCRTTNPY